MVEWYFSIGTQSLASAGFIKYPTKNEVLSTLNSVWMTMASLKLMLHYILNTTNNKCFSAWLSQFRNNRTILFTIHTIHRHFIHILIHLHCVITLICLTQINHDHLYQMSQTHSYFIPDHFISHFPFQFQINTSSLNSPSLFHCSFSAWDTMS